MKIVGLAAGSWFMQWSRNTYRV